MFSLTPLVLFIYNRPQHTELTLEYLSRNKLAKETQLFIFADGPKCKSDERLVYATRQVPRKYFKKFKKVTVKYSERNNGLAKSIINNITNLFESYNALIVIEDDLKTSPWFLTFMNNALYYYQDNINVKSISGYIFKDFDSKCVDYKYDVFFSLRNSSWGWATWKHEWDTIDWNADVYKDIKYSFKQKYLFNKGGNDLTLMLRLKSRGIIDSWAIIFSYYHFIESKYSITPIKSLVSNIGVDGSGTNTFLRWKSEKYLNRLDENEFPKLFPSTPADDNIRCVKAFKKISDKSIILLLLDYFPGLKLMVKKIVKVVWRMYGSCCLAQKE